MKKSIILSLFLFSTISLFSQRETYTEDLFTRKGRVLVETGYNLIGGIGAGGTGFTSYSQNDETITSIGAEGGYFITEDLALKIAISAITANDNTLSSTAIGLKYYIIGKIPVDLTYGRLSNGDDSAGLGNFSVGYAVGLADNITLEPSIGLLFGDEDGIGEDPVGKFSLKFAMFL